MTKKSNMNYSGITVNNSQEFPRKYDLTVHFNN